MSVRPAAASNLPTPADMERLVAQAGLSLNAGQMADLALGWRQIAGLIARIPRDRPLRDDLACVFRLPPPTASKPPAGKRPARARMPDPAKAAAKGTVPAAKTAAARKAAPRKAATGPAAKQAAAEGKRA